MLNTRILALGIFTDKNSVNIVVRRFIPFDGCTWPDVGKKIECATEGQIKWDVTFSDWAKPKFLKLVITTAKENTYSVLPKVLETHNALRHKANRTPPNTPLRATVFFLTEVIAESGITVFPPLNTGVTLTSSHSIGTYELHEEI